MDENRLDVLLAPYNPWWTNGRESSSFYRLRNNDKWAVAYPFTAALKPSTLPATAHFQDQIFHAMRGISIEESGMAALMIWFLSLR